MSESNLKLLLKKTFTKNQLLIIEACELGYGEELFVKRLREVNEELLSKMKEFKYTI